jgi:hypothetical protein
MKKPILIGALAFFAVAFAICAAITYGNMQRVASPRFLQWTILAITSGVAIYFVQRRRKPVRPAEKDPAPLSEQPAPAASVPVAPEPPPRLSEVTAMIPKAPDPPVLKDDEEPKPDEAKAPSDPAEEKEAEDPAGSLDQPPWSDEELAAFTGTPLEVVPPGGFVDPLYLKELMSDSLLAENPQGNSGQQGDGSDEPVAPVPEATDITPTDGELSPMAEATASQEEPPPEPSGGEIENAEVVALVAQPEENQNAPAGENEADKEKEMEKYFALQMLLEQRRVLESSRPTNPLEEVLRAMKLRALEAQIDRAESDLVDFRTKLETTQGALEFLEHLESQGTPEGDKDSVAFLEWMENHHPRLLAAKRFLNTPPCLRLPDDEQALKEFTSTKVGSVQGLEFVKDLLDKEGTDEAAWLMASTREQLEAERAWHVENTEDWKDRLAFTKLIEDTIANRFPESAS